MTNWDELTNIQKEATIAILKQASASSLGTTAYGAIKELPGKIWGGIKKDISTLGTNIESNIAKDRKSQYGATSLLPGILGAGLVGYGGYLLSKPLIGAAVKAPFRLAKLPLKLFSRGKIR